MSLSCFCGEWDGEGVAWFGPKDYKPLPGLRSRRCASCKDLIAPTELCGAFSRMRAPKDDIEMRIHGEDAEIFLADWFFCETCTDLYFSLEELGYCISLGDDNMKELIKEYAEQHKERTA